MIEVSAKGMQIFMGEAERKAVIDHAETLFAAAVVFTEECLDFMAAQHLAERTAIDPTLFYYTHLGDRIENAISGRPMKTVFEAVKYNLDNVRPVYLGMAPRNEVTAAVIARNQRDYADIKAKAAVPAPVPA